MSVNLKSLNFNEMDFISSINDSFAFNIEQGFKLAGKEYNLHITELLKTVDAKIMEPCVLTILFLNPFLKNIYHPQGDTITDEDFMRYILNLIQKYKGA